MKISFTTLGCPDWDLDTICRRGQEYGYDGVDLRGYLGAMDVTRLPEFTAQAAQTRRQLAEAGLAVSGISSDIKICRADLLEDNLEEARRTIALAQDFDVQNVRIFGNGSLETHSRAELLTTGRSTMEQILALDGAADLRWLFETHDIWVRSADCKALLDSIPHPAFGALWDIGHTPRVAGESPAETYAQIGPRVGYIHLKDALYEPHHPQAMNDGWRYVAPGTGQLPLAQAVHLLQDSGYDGWLTFEHEKRWHRELPEPEEAFPAYARWIRGIL